MLIASLPLSTTKSEKVNCPSRAPVRVRQDANVMIKGPRKWSKRVWLVFLTIKKKYFPLCQYFWKFNIRYLEQFISIISCKNYLLVTAMDVTKDKSQEYDKHMSFHDADATRSAAVYTCTSVRRRASSRFNTSGKGKILRNCTLFVIYYLTNSLAWAQNNATWSWYITLPEKVDKGAIGDRRKPPCVDFPPQIPLHSAALLNLTRKCECYILNT